MFNNLNSFKDKLNTAVTQSTQAFQEALKANATDTDELLDPPETPDDSLATSTLPLEVVEKLEKLKRYEKKFPGMCYFTIVFFHLLPF